jgi:hypothetical protein
MQTQKKYLIFAVVAISIPFLLVLILPRILTAPTQSSTPQTQRTIDQETLDELTPSQTVPIEASPTPEATGEVQGVNVTQ